MKSKKNKGLYIIIIFIVILLLALAFILIYSKYISKETNNIQSKQLTNMETTQPTNIQTNNQSMESDISESQTVVIKNIEIESDSMQFDNIIYSSIVNNTKHKIVGFKRGMLSFDKEGNPMDIYWIGIDSSVPRSYYHLYESTNENILPGEETEPVGWTFESMRGEEENSRYDDIGFIIYTFKEISFDNGEIWNNPDYERWLETYKEQKVDVDKLSKYYPHTQDIGTIK